MVDILGVESKSEGYLKYQRIIVHAGMSFVIAIIIISFKMVNEPSVISSLFKAAGYTYGPLLGLFAFGLITRRKVLEGMVPFIAVISPVTLFYINKYSEQLFNGYQMGFEVLIYNGLLTFITLFVFSKRAINQIN